MSQQPVVQEEASDSPYSQQESLHHVPAMPPVPVTPQLNTYRAPPPPVYSEPVWSELGGVRPPMRGYAGGPFPAAGYPGFGQPVTPPARRRGLSLAFILLLTLLAVVLISSSIIVSIVIVQFRKEAAVSTLAVTATPTDPRQQLYQKVTGKKPTYIDPLTDVTASNWEIYEEQQSGCSFKSDGLHVHVEKINWFFYCDSGWGEFTNFAMQVDMKILTGQGGISFRSNDKVGNLYYIVFFSDGTYMFAKEANNQGILLAEGGTGLFTTGHGHSNTVTVIAQGSKMFFYVNQKFFTQVSDSTYTNGNIGVLAYDDTRASEVVYTNAKIWTL